LWDELFQIETVLLVGVFLRRIRCIAIV